MTDVACVNQLLSTVYRCWCRRGCDGTEQRRDESGRGQDVYRFSTSFQPNPSAASALLREIVSLDASEQVRLRG